MNILLLSYIIEWKMVEVPKIIKYINIYIYIFIYKMIFNNTLNFKAQLITYI